MKFIASSGVLALASVATGFVIPEEHVLQSLAALKEPSVSPQTTTSSLSDSVDLNSLGAYLAEHQVSQFRVDDNEFNSADILDNNDFKEAVDFFHDEAPYRHLPDHYEPESRNIWSHKNTPYAEPSTDVDIHTPEQLAHLAQSPHHHKPNLTVYELISKSKYTTKFAKLISEYDDLVELLNGTTANFTIFAPTDKAFDKIPHHGGKEHKPSKEFIKAVLKYHMSESFYPAGRVLASRTIPTLLESEQLGDKPQRLSEQISFKGLTLDFYSRVVAIDIFGTNGVIHGIDSILVPPPKAATIISLLPGTFSTLALGLEKTGLFSALNDTSTHIGGTFFAPSNGAFARLGPKINAFLFSPPGLKYLKALLEYHLVKGETLYSDMLYKSDGTSHPIPKGHFHVSFKFHSTRSLFSANRYQIDLPTVLPSHHLSIDIARLGRIIKLKINGFSAPVIMDGITSDGVIHLLSQVLIPPKHAGALPSFYQGEYIEVEDLKSRLDALEHCTGHPGEAIESLSYVRPEVEDEGGKGAVRFWRAKQERRKKVQEDREMLEVAKMMREEDLVEEPETVKVEEQTVQWEL